MVRSSDHDVYPATRAAGSRKTLVILPRMLFLKCSGNAVERATSGPTKNIMDGET